MKEATHLILDNSKTPVGFLHYIAITLWMGWLMFFPLSLLLLPVMIFTLPVIMASCLCSIDRKKQPYLGKILGNWLITKSTEYLGLKVYAIDKEAVDNAGPSIFVIEPHDVLPLGISTFHDALGIWPTHKALGGVSSAIFSVPLMRHIFTWCSAVEVTKSRLLDSLKRGYSVAVCPGGAHEVAYMEKDNEIVLYMKSRYGLVKLCLETGTPLIPSFCFGQRKIYNYWVPKNKTLQVFCRKLGFMPLYFTGYFGIPFAPPKSLPITVVVGKPITIPKVENPTEEQMHEYHDLLVQSITDIFESHKAANGMEDCSIRIV
jgi:diacylglycerol O-acyltransferase 2, plant